jgi:hypothetical protein
MQSAFPSVFIICLFFPLLLTAQSAPITDDFSTICEWRASSGRWEISSAGELCQRDARENAAMITRPLAQAGTVTYRFDLTIDNGFDDDYGGFGFHIAVGDPTPVRSWGNGRSLLLWFTYDKAAYGAASFFGQLYESTGIITMSMLHAGARYPLEFGDFSQGNPGALVGKKMKIVVTVNTATGEGTLLDPFGEDVIYRFSFGRRIPPGGFFTFRTNSLAVSIDNFQVTRLEE